MGDLDGRAMHQCLHRELAWVRALVDLAGAQSRDVPDEGALASLRAEVETWRAQADLFDPHGSDARSPLAEVTDAFQLTRVDRLLLTVAAAPDLDPCFGPAFADIVGDVAEHRATPELVGRLLGTDPYSQWGFCDRLGSAMPLRESRLVTLIGDRPYPERPIVPADVLIEYLRTGRAALDPSLAEFARLGGVEEASGLLALDRAAPPAQAARLEEHARRWRQERGAPGLLLQTASELTATRIAAALAASAARSVLDLDLASVVPSTSSIVELLGLAERDARLGHAVLVIRGAEALAANPSTRHAMQVIAAWTRDVRVPVVVHGRPDSGLRGALPDLVSVSVAVPTERERTHLWEMAAIGSGTALSPQDATDLGRVFSFDGATIQQVFDAAAREADPSSDGEPQRLREIAGAIAGAPMLGVARRVEPRIRLDDLVLAPATRAHLLELAAAGRHRRATVLKWGVGGPTARGLGVSALFYGPSGTGKTSAGEALAADLQVDLYIVDLATVVSKYIGETERNLRSVFDAARASDAVLLFDEADALFGKRTPVHDAHDRYANIETAYLLQLMDVFDGVAVLTTNLRTNIDPAFSRRLGHVVEFQPPDVSQRALLWRTMLGEAPCSDDLDVALLAEHFDFAGGAIRNAALHASSLAAADGGVIGMTHALVAAAREMRKESRVPTQEQFGRWHDAVLAQIAPVGAPW